MPHPVRTEHRATLQSLERSLSPAFRGKLRRLAGHLHVNVNELFEEIGIAALADKLRSPRSVVTAVDGPLAPGGLVETIIDDEKERRALEHRYLYYHLRHRQRLVRPTWASIFVQRLSPEVCALWARSERGSEQSFRPGVTLRDVVYLPEQEFRRFEREILLPALERWALIHGSAETTISTAAGKN